MNLTKQLVPAEASMSLAVWGNRRFLLTLLGAVAMSLLMASCAHCRDNPPPVAVEFDTSRLTTDAQLTVHFEPPLITGTTFFLRVPGGPVYWLGPAQGNGEANFGVVDSNVIASFAIAVPYESAELVLPYLPHYRGAELCFNEDFCFCAPINAT